ncbi:MAG TPA: ATP-binding cassette domain-containing protein, partial [Cytophagaceae bacterium]
VLGKEISQLDEEGLIELRRNVGYLFQEGALYDSMTVGENISFSLERQIKKQTPEEIDFIVKSTLQKLGLLNAIHKMPDELSGGMKKRVALARTLALKPSIILYDEPTAGLDPATSKEIIELILEMKNTFGISGIIATHDLVCARLASDRILILHEGSVEAEGTFSSLEQSDNKHVKQFFQY